MITHSCRFATIFDRTCCTLQVAKQWVLHTPLGGGGGVIGGVNWDRKEGRSVEKTKRVTRTIIVNRSRGRGGEGVIIKCRVVHESLTPPPPLPPSLPPSNPHSLNILTHL